MTTLVPKHARSCSRRDHVRLAPWPDHRPDRVQRGRARNVERAPIRATPCQVSAVLGHDDRSEVLTEGGDDPGPARACDPDVAALVALHAVRDPILDDPRTDAFEEDPAV